MPTSAQTLQKLECHSKCIGMHGGSDSCTCSSIGSRRAGCSACESAPVQGLRQSPCTVHAPAFTHAKAAGVRRGVDDPYSGHLGSNNTERNINEHYWWPRMQRDIIQFVKVCPTCQRDRKPTQKPAGELQSLAVPRDTWTSISMNFITGLPTTKRGKNAIMVVVDRMSKMVHLIANTTDLNAQGVAQLFQDRVFCLHGIPDDIVSDRDTRFTSAFWQELQKLLGTSLSMSTAFHPQADG